MKIKKEFAVRNIAGDFVMVPIGQAAIEFSGLISTNEVGAFLWQCLQQEITLEQLQSKLLDEFDVDEKTASEDIQEFLEKLEKLDLLDTQATEK